MGWGVQWWHQSVPLQWLMGSWVSVTPLCPTSPGLSPALLLIKPHARKTKVPHGFGGVRAEKGAPQWGAGDLSLQLRHQVCSPQAFMFGGGGASGRKREDGDAIIPHPPKKTGAGTPGPLSSNRNHTTAHKGTAEITAGPKLALLCVNPLWVPPGILRPGRGAPHGQWAPGRWGRVGQARPGSSGSSSRCGRSPRGHIRGAATSR